MTDLRKLSEAATQGEWSAYLYREEITGNDAPAGILCNLNGQPVGDDMEHANAEFLAALVNAFRAGTLVDVSDLASLVKPLVWVEDGEGYASRDTHHKIYRDKGGWVAVYPTPDRYQSYLSGLVSWEAAKAAAEAHWIAQVLAAFDLPAKEEDL